ncbi:hypothetical protein TNCV_114581 [Trichonephila clavipes]|nr:hypothetical protein TNCV_114581 [Trichonephila clavipes]
MHSSNIFSFRELLNISSPVWPCIVINKNKFLSNITSEKTPTGKDHFFTIAVFGCKISVENVELNPPVQYNASLVDNSRAPVPVYFVHVTGMKPCPNVSPK